MVESKVAGRHPVNQDDLAELDVLYEGLLGVFAVTQSPACYEIAQRLLFIINRTKANPPE